MIERTLGKFIRYRGTANVDAETLEAACRHTARVIRSKPDDALCRCMAEDGSWFTVTAGEVKADLLQAGVVG
jgi:hypothetical protein